MKLDEFCQEHLLLAADFWWLHVHATDTFEVSSSIRNCLGHIATDITDSASWSRIIHESDLAISLPSARIRFRSRHGGWKTMLVRTRAVLEDGVQTATLGMAREIDDVIAMEEELLLRNEDLAQVASVLSHDFRGPARHIAGCIDRVIEQIDEASRTQAPFSLAVAMNWARLTQSAADRLGRMIADVTLYSQAGTKAIKPENIAVSEVVHDVLRDYADRIKERNAVVKTNMLPTVFYDPTMLYLLLANLISNAIKFSKKSDPAPTVWIDGRSTVGEWVAIAVRDSGIGFQQAQCERILEMGFRLHHESEYPGFGYGLAFVKRILNRCGGALGVRSKVGEGSEFILKLPGGRT